MLKGARVWQCSPDAPWDFTWRFRRLGNVPRGKAWARLGNRPQQGFDRPREPSLRKPPVFTHSARERDAASSGAGSAGGCTVQGPQLVPRCASRVLRRRPREGSALATGQTGNSARRRGQRGASWRRPKLAREGEGSTAGSRLQPQLALVLRVLRRRPRVRSLLWQLRRPLRCVYSEGADNKEGASWRWRQDCDCCTGSGFCWLETQC